MKIFLSGCFIPLFILAGAPAQALESFVLLDDFSGDRIDKGIWDGSQRPHRDVLDFAREVQGGELRLLNRSYADDPSPGQRNDTSVRLFLNSGDPVTQMLALFRVNAVEISGCTASAIRSHISGRLRGWFFTTGGPPAPFDATRNIFAAIRVQRWSDSVDPPGVMQVVATVFRCGDPDCDTGDRLLFDTTSLGTITPGQLTLLALVWDPDNDRFIFLRDSVAQFVILNYNGLLTDVDPPSSDIDFVHKRVEVRAAIENCVTGPRASGFMELFVDKLWVNQSAVGP